MSKVVRKNEYENKYSKFNRQRRREVKIAVKLFIRIILLVIIIMAIALIVKSIKSDSSVGAEDQNATGSAASTKVTILEEPKSEVEPEVEEMPIDLLIQNVEEEETFYNDPDEIFSDPDEDNYYWEQKFQIELEAETSEIKEPLPIEMDEEGNVINIVLGDEEVKTWTEDDEKYLIMVLTGECQNRDYDIQLLYGSVVLNRAASKRFPNTIKEVCLQKGQYSCFADGNAYRTPTDTTKEAALYLLENGSQIPANVVFQARFKQGDGVWKVVQGEYFCYLNDY